MRKLIVINLIVLITLIFLLEIFANFFKLSGLMGIQSGLIYEKNEFHFLSPNTSGIVFGKKVYTDKYGFRVPKLTFDYKSISCPGNGNGGGIEYSIQGNKK